MTLANARRMVAGLAFAVLVAYGFAAGLTGSPVLVSDAVAQTEGRVPGQALGNVSDAEMWRQVRQGVAGTVSIPDKKAGVLVQSEGDNWRAWRNGPIAVVGAIAFWVMFFVVFGFYQLRGKVKVSHGYSGRKMLRFGGIERFSHWLIAGSFVILAITGVNMLYGKHVLIPVFGQEGFAALAQYGKYIHNYVAFAFMAGLVMIFVLWVKDNLWDRYDFNWIIKGGGLIIPGQHPAAAKFNFGQKTVFWMVIIGGLVLAVTGVNLLFPFRWVDLQMMQWMQAAHATLSQVLCALMVAHIYIGTIGMENAIHAMTDGYVDENWAKEHHSAWAEKALADEAAAAREAPAGGAGQPAE